MNETLKKFTAEIRAQMAEILGGAEVKTLIDATKASSDTGSFEVVISTDNVDRQGEVIRQDGWDLANYLANPVVLWGHDYFSLPIGVCDEITVTGGKLTARGRFAPEAANPFAQQVRRLYDLKIVRATSVGFIDVEREGNVIMRAELLEFSFVPVPANPYALSLSKAQELKLDLAMIATKGLKLETKEDAPSGDAPAKPEAQDGEGAPPAEPPKDEKATAAEGDACDMPDGTIGEMHPNDAGEMVCMPAPAKAEKFGALEIPAEKKDAQIIGAILAELQNIVTDAIVRSAKLILDIYQTELGQSQAGKEQIAAVLKSSKSLQAIKEAIADLEQKLGAGGGEERPDGAAPKERSEDKGLMEPMRAVDDFLMARNILKSFSQATSQALERLNEREREARKARRQQK